MQIVAVEMPNPVPNTIAASGSWLSGIIYSNGYQVISVGITMNQAGTLKITRYIDMAGTILQGTPTSGTIVGGTALIVNVTDDLPFVTFQLGVPSPNTRNF
jgi:hypothetical protein